jgi:hypothetical protein
MREGIQIERMQPQGRSSRWQAAFPDNCVATTGGAKHHGKSGPHQNSILLLIAKLFVKIKKISRHEWRKEETKEEAEGRPQHTWRAVSPFTTRRVAETETEKSA